MKIDPADQHGYADTIAMLAKGIYEKSLVVVRFNIEMSLIGPMRLTVECVPVVPQAPSDTKAAEPVNQTLQ